MSTTRTIPISLLTVSKDGKPSIDKQAVLDTREKTVELETNKPFKLNADTTGVCALPSIIPTHAFR